MNAITNYPNQILYTGVGPLDVGTSFNTLEDLQADQGAYPGKLAHVTSEGATYLRRRDGTWQKFFDDDGNVFMLAGETLVKLSAVVDDKGTVRIEIDSSTK